MESLSGGNALYELSCSIQSGGESRRMGQNKALMPFMGQPLIARVLNRLAPIAREIFITTNELESFQFLNIPLYKDVILGKGALGGLYTALWAARFPVVAVVACDMPFVNPALILAQRARLLDENMDVVIPRSPTGLETLHAVYRRDVCLPAVLEALKTEQRRMISWFPAVKVRVMEADEVAQFDPDFRSFINVNTPEEFRQAEALAENAGL